MKYHVKKIFDVRKLGSATSVYIYWFWKGSNVEPDRVTDHNRKSIVELGSAAVGMGAHGHLFSS